MRVRQMTAALTCAIPSLATSGTLDAATSLAALLADTDTAMTHVAPLPALSDRAGPGFARWIATRYAETLPAEQEIIAQMLAAAAFGPVNGPHTGFVLVGPPGRQGPEIIHFSLFGTAGPAAFAPVGGGLPLIAGRSTSVIEALPIDEPERYVETMMSADAKPWAIPVDQGF